jgi:hypothetical protein
MCWPEALAGHWFQVLAVPGTNLNPADAGWQPPVLTDPAARRRPASARALT